MLNTLYAAAARRRRERYAAHPELRHRLRRPVISVGNLAVGGRGKTPLAASIARMLLDLGERPAILSRGYARAQSEDSVVVVRDPEGIRADLARSGDEPLMLARQLPGASVLACPDRYLAGRFAEQHLDTTVHILDDGFQHLRLERDIDLLLISREDVERPQTLPGGRLREPLDTMVAADAVLLTDNDVVLDIAGLDMPVFGIRRSGAFAPPDSGPAVAVAGIAAPDRFFSDLRAHQWNLVATMVYGDHHRYTARDVAKMMRTAARTNAIRIVTTEKDLVRLLPFRPFAVPVTCVTLRLEPDPIDRFRVWLVGQLRAVRDEPPLPAEAS